MHQNPFDDVLLEILDRLDWVQRIFTDRCCLKHAVSASHGPTRSAAGNDLAHTRRASPCRRQALLSP